VGGDRPSADGHVELLSSPAEYPARAMRSAAGTAAITVTAFGSRLFADVHAAAAAGI
jgi:hypothetical protein